MNKNNSLNIVFEDLFKLIINLISDDLKVQKHLYNLNLSGVDTNSLQLQLHDGIFLLVGFKMNEVTEEIKQWYFHQTERVFTIDISNDQQAFQNLSAEILYGLLKERKNVFSKSIE